VSEVGIAIIDTQAIRILDQEFRDSRIALDDAKTNLTAIMAEKMAVDRKVKELEDKIKMHEGYTIQALDKGDKSLASDLANKIADFEHELKIQQDIWVEYGIKITRLKKMITKSERTIKSMDREISIVKTTERVQQANDLVSANFSGSDSSLRNAMDSLQRIKQRQQKCEDQATAMVELDEEPEPGDLQDRLEKAGIIESGRSGPSGTLVLERIKKPGVQYLKN
jgi:phage shock protein A